MRGGAIAALATSSFVFVTAETLPVGLLPDIAAGLSVGEADVGLLLTSYAVVAAAATIPLTALTMRIPRHRLIALLVVIFTVSQAAAALAPTFGVLVATRLVSALAHGVFWSALAPAAARLAPPGQAGRATSLVFVGNSAALVLGVPLGTALGQAAGWRVAIAVLAAAGALSAIALVTLLPKLPAHPSNLTSGVAARLRTAATVLRSRGVTVVCVVTVVMVVAHFVAYTYLAPLVRENGGLDGLALSALLLGYGGLSLLGNVLIGRIVDRHPGTVLAGSILACVAGLTTLALVDGSVVTVVAVLVWGAGFAGIPLTLQAVILRVAPKAQDASSAVYVVAFQIGIGGGAFLGERLVSAGHLGLLPAVGAAVAAVSAVVVLSSRRTFPRRVVVAPQAEVVS